MLGRVSNWFQGTLINSQTTSHRPRLYALSKAIVIWQSYRRAIITKQAPLEDLNSRPLYSSINNNDLNNQKKSRIASIHSISGTRTEPTTLMPDLSPVSRDGISQRMA
jgi:hypothetical protein